mgnify:CR=1 FL=1
MNQVNPTPRTSANAGVSESIFVAFVLFLTIYYVDQIDESNLFWRAMQDSSHTLVFFLGTYLSLRCMTALRLFPSFTNGARIALVLSLSFIAGITIEIVQPFFGRSASFLDIWYDLLGCTAGALIFYLRVHLPNQERQNHTQEHPSNDHEKSRSAFKKAGLTLTTLALLSISCILPAYYSRVLTLQDTAMPVLFNFDADWEKEFLRLQAGAHLSIVDAPKGWAKHDSKVAKLTLSSQQYPGLTFRDLPQDWSKYQFLKLEIFSKQSPTNAITLRIHDQQHNNRYQDRFNLSLKLSAGLNEIKIPLRNVSLAPTNREMNLQQIAGMAIFTIKPQSLSSIYLDNIRLE